MTMAENPTQNIHEYLAEFEDIPGTRVYTAARARRGYWINQFAMSMMKPENRALQGGRARLSGRMGYFGRRQAGPAAPRL
jgi:hypothetical protein